MNKTKILSILIALLLCLSLCACSGGETDAADTTSAAPTESTPSGSDPSPSGGSENSEEYTGAGIGDNDKDNLISATDISAQ